MNRKTASRQDNRRRQLAAIHVAKKALGLDDDVYRDLVARVSAGHGPAVRSAGDCSPAQRSAILRELARLQGEPAERALQARTWAGKPKGNLSPQLAKVEALLADAGREWAYAHSLAHRMFDVERVEWCNPDQLRKVIAALVYDARRRARKQVAK